MLVLDSGGVSFLAKRNQDVVAAIRALIRDGYQTSWHRADLTRFELGLSTTSGSRYDIISGEES